MMEGCLASGGLCALMGMKLDMPTCPANVIFFYADAEDTERIISGMSQLEMLLMSAPMHRTVLLSTKTIMGILHCLWATTWSVLNRTFFSQKFVVTDSPLSLY